MKRSSNYRGCFAAAAAVVGLLASSSSIYAAAIASDNANDAAYTANNNWVYGSNGGTGFSQWYLTNGADAGTSGGAGYFLGDSTQNGNIPSGGINVNGHAWGLYAYNGGYANGYRQFTADSNGNAALTLNQQFSVSLDNGYINGSADNATDRSIDVSLQTLGDGVNRFDFYFASNTADYVYYDATGAHDTGIRYTDGGLTLTYTVTGTNTFALTVVSLGSGQTESFTGVVQGSPTIYDIGQFHVGDSNYHGDANWDYYINSLSIVNTPEPASLSLLTCGGLLALGRRRRTT